MEFTFPVSVPDIATVPAQFQSLYAQVDGKGDFTISQAPEVKGAVEGLVGLGKALAAARRDADDLKKKKVDLSPLKEFGEDPASIATTIQGQIKALQDQLAGEGKKKLDLEEMRKSMGDAHGKDKEAWAQKNAALQAQLFDLLVKKEAVSAVAAQKGDTAILMPFIERSVKVEQLENGSMQVYVVDEHGNKRYSGTGSLMTVAERVAEMKADKTYAKLFESETKGGGGAPPGGGAGRAKAGADDDADLTPTQKIAKGLAKGQQQQGWGAGARGAKAPAGM